jgi:hypothetical protein
MAYVHPSMRKTILVLSLAMFFFVVTCSAGEAVPEEPIDDLDGGPWTYPKDEGGSGELDDLGDAFVESYPDVDGPLDSDVLESLKQPPETTPPSKQQAGAETTAPQAGTGPALRPPSTQQPAAAHVEK